MYSRLYFYYVLLITYASAIDIQVYNYISSFNTINTILCYVNYVRQYIISYVYMYYNYIYGRHVGTTTNWKKSIYIYDRYVHNVLDVFI